MVCSLTNGYPLPLGGKRKIATNQKPTTLVQRLMGA